MSRNVTVTDAAKHFGSLIATIGDIEEARIVDDGGEVVAILLSPGAYRQGIRDRDWGEVDRASGSNPDATHVSDRDREAAWQRFWATVDRIRERNADKDPEEVYRDITEIVEEVRQERYEAEQRRIAQRRR